MRITLIGIGAMGCLFAGRLSPLADVVMLGRWPEQLAALRQRGLILIQPDGRSTHYAVRATDNPAEINPCDLALILVKSHQTKRAASQAAQLLTQNGLALTLQNGLGNLEKVAAAVGPARAALGVTTQGANVLSPGVVRHAGFGPVYLATQPVTAARLVEVARLFQAAGMETTLVERVDELVWRKLAVNAGINPLTALLGVPNGFLVENETARQLMIQAAQEAAAVARAQGIALSDEEAAGQVLAVAQATAANRSSMLQDVARGAPTEIEPISGAITRLGQQYAIATPTNELFGHRVKQLETGAWRFGADPVANLQWLLSHQED
ncbi:MAG: 2-dehydropantoate 2-reductase [Chloroflexota bacterium]